MGTYYVRILFLCTIIILTIDKVVSKTEYPCKRKLTDFGSVCTCDSDYCDTVPTLSSFEDEGEYQLYSTSLDNLGFHSTQGTFSDAGDAADIEITVDIHNKKVNGSTIIGFGGAFTDSTGFNILSLPVAAQTKLLKAYFGPDGIEYTLGRVPIGGADFSSRYYSYQDDEDPTLSNFTLQMEDFEYKISLLHRVKNIMRNEKDLKLIASAWTAPPWMKTNHNWTSIGFLKEEYYQAWADYYVKFFEAYKNEDVTFWGVTNQNEPLTGYLPQENFEGFPSMAWLPGQINNWIGTFFGPVIRNSNFRDLKIITHDDQRFLLPLLRAFILSNATTLQYIDGIGVHYYGDTITPPAWLDFPSYQRNKSIFILATEACNGFESKDGKEEAVALGSWERAEKYLRSIFDDLSFGLVGWMDWNMALNLEGGPLLINNKVDSPVIVNATAGEFYKQPMFYVLGHFSKFVTPGSSLITTEVSSIYGEYVDTQNVESLGYLRSDNKVVVIIWNKKDVNVTVSVKNMLVPNSKRTVFTVEARSINSLLYSSV